MENVDLLCFEMKLTVPLEKELRLKQTAFWPLVYTELRQRRNGQPRH